MSQEGNEEPGHERRPHTGEAPFALEELFYSRTDPRGVIQSGNDIFQRVSGYGWDKLVGAPHKLVRHPDMPRAVFWLLWSSIQQGRPIGAYVKNRAADGLYYWVFAVVTPIEGGFLSVRIKPSSDLFPVVVEEYAAQRAAEGDRAITPEESAQRLLARLKALGFHSYEAFMAQALTKEMSARDAQLGREADPFPPAIWAVKQALDHANTEVKSLIETFSTIRLMPTNMRIAASRLEPSGGPISAISENYRIMAQEVIDQLGDFSRDGRPLVDTWLELVHEAAFLHCVARLQQETVRQTESVAPGQGVGEQFDEVAETGVLVKQMLDYRDKARSALAGVIFEVQKLPPLCASLRQRVVGLDAVRRSCRVENSWLGNRGGGLASIIEQLDAFHVDTEGRLNRITESAIEVGSRLRQLEQRHNRNHAMIVERSTKVARTAESRRTHQIPQEVSVRQGSAAAALP